MKITHNGTRFELTLAIDPATNWVSLPEITTAKDAGFAWDREAKVWWTCDVAVVSRLKGTGATASPQVKALIAAESERAAQAVVQSRATDSELDIPAPEGLSYLAYQKAGIAYALRIFGDLK